MAPPALSVLEYHLVGYRRVWRSTVASSLAQPVLLFLGMGVAVGTLVDRGGALHVPYLQFTAPGLLALSILHLALAESGSPVLSAFKWQRIYFAMAAAPLRAIDMIAGRLGYIAVRVVIATVVFLLVMVLFGAVRSAWAAVAPAITMLLALATAAPMLAYASTVQSANLMAVLVRFGVLPMVLFSGVFFPVQQLPGLFQPVAFALPLWHGVELTRAATLGVGTAWPVPVHLAVLGLWFAAGLALAHVRFTARLAA